MDKFVVRQKKWTTTSASGNSRTSHLKQSKLHQLAGVVVFEDIEFARQRLISADTSIEEKIALLEKLGDKKPSQEVLKKTGIGRVVHKLMRSQDRALSAAAGSLYSHWKAHILHIIQRKPLEVESDLQTKRGRANAVKLINGGLDNEGVSRVVEGEIFKKCRRVMTCDYTRLTRKAHFAFKNHKDLREQACREDFDVASFVNDLKNNLVKIYANTESES